ncbi:MAG: glycoside hydrolase [Candidatus Hydrogenedentota bacterium]
MNGPQSILVLTADYPPIEGGIATVTLELSRELARQGHKVTVIAPGFPDMAEFDRNEPVTIIRYDGYGWGWFRTIPMYRAARPYFDSSDWLFAINVASAGLIGWFARRRHGLRYAAFAYAYEFLKFHAEGPFAAVLRRIYRNAAAVIAISRFTRDKLVAFGASKENLHIVLPGAAEPLPISGEEMDAVRRRYVLEGARVILAVGRFIPRKGHLTLVRAMPEILAQAPDAVLVMVGRGPTLSAVAREAHALGVRDHVVLPGRLSDREVAALYAECDVFALPTATEGPHVEGFGLVFAEAHAHGKPVVAGDTGGVPEAVIDGATGYLVPPEHVHETAEAIGKLLLNPDLSHDFGEAGRERVERELNWRVFTQRVMEILEAAP